MKITKTALNKMEQRNIRLNKSFYAPHDVFDLYKQDKVFYIEDEIDNINYMNYIARIALDTVDKIDVVIDVHGHLTTMATLKDGTYLYVTP